jgi:hypothetical protein
MIPTACSNFAPNCATIILNRSSPRTYPMAIQILEGILECKPFGPNTWALVTTDETYELLEPDPQLQQDGKRAKLTGQVRADVMTIAMIGPVFEVTSFEFL